MREGLKWLSVYEHFALNRLNRDGGRSLNNTTVGMNKVTGVIESFPSNLKTFWKSLNLLSVTKILRPASNVASGTPCRTKFRN